MRQKTRSRAMVAETDGSPTPTRMLTIVAQDPTVRVSGRILTARVSVPNEGLSAGPRGYRVHVVDYDSTSNRMLVPLDAAMMGTTADPKDPWELKGPAPHDYNERLLNDPRFHAQNAYAITMRTLAYFERALGRRVSWSFGGHQIKIAPHAFAEANAFYSPKDESLLFGYFAGTGGATVFTSLSHDIVAHETTHALLDGLRPRYMEPSSPDQGAFHEGFADVVALLSVFSVREVVEYAVAQALKDTDRASVQLSRLTTDALKRGVLLGLGEQFGEGLSGVHGESLRRSITIRPSRDLKDREEYKEEHRRGELLVAAVLHGFLGAYEARLRTLGQDSSGRLPAARVAEEGADIAERLLVMVIRALDYTPATDVNFGDFLSALLTSDREIRPDDSRYSLRTYLLDAFAQFGFDPVSSYRGEPGRWEPPLADLTYRFVHRDALLRDRDEVFRFLWDNREALGLCDQAYTEVGGVRPCLRVDQEGFTLRETVADYVQILTVRAEELEAIPIPGRKGRIQRPNGLLGWWPVRLLGGGALIFDEFGHLKYHIRNSLLNPDRQTERLKHLAAAGLLGREKPVRGFQTLHMKGARPSLPRFTPERLRWL